MKCYVCGRKFADGEPVVGICRYVTNEKRGDFVGLNPTQYAHAYHLRALKA
jgi:hypothetical protein